MNETLSLVDALSPIHLAQIDTFQTAQNLGTRAEALSLLLDIAIEVVTDTGDRFWDYKPRRPRRIGAPLAGSASIKAVSPTSRRRGAADNRDR